ncbi:MAG: sulfatase-like hydrolase/transferase [Acidimicrobiales bacterium]|nr:sulfatase-like hydrolase/transferase [Acidimicrobiales bacterium]
MKTIFISLDTLCADRLSCLGGTRVPTPNLDTLASGSALFTNAFASDIPTQPSHTSVFTGRYGINTGIVSHFHPPAALSEAPAWLPSVFQGLGHRTGAVDHLFTMKDWFIRGYDDYMVPEGRSRSPASVINELAFPWLDEHRHDDFFLFLHYWDAHIPYVPPEPFKSEFTGFLSRVIDPSIDAKLRSRPSYPLFKQNLYDHLDQIPSLDYIEALHYAEIAYLDFELGRLFNRLDELGLLDETMIVVFGDHGEIMTEHDAWFDHAGLYDSVVHVPLLIWGPGLVRPGQTDALVSLVDVMPTVLELQGIATVEGSQGMDGLSLVQLIEGRDDRHRDVVMLSECTWQAKRGVRTTEWKYIRCWDPGIYPRSEPELYNVQTDPFEQRNVAGNYPSVVDRLDHLIQEWIDTSLTGRTDPMLEVIECGLPAVRRLANVVPARAEPPDRMVIDLRQIDRQVAVQD